MRLIKMAIGDVLLTSLWVFVLPFVGVIVSIISSFFSIKPATTPALLVTLTLISSVVLVFFVLSAAMGGANFNPSTTVFFYAVGMNTSETLYSLAVRLPAQALGGIGGVIGVLWAIPATYRPMLRGPSLKTTMAQGAAIEALISFTFCAVLLLVMTRGPRLLIAKVLLLGVCTMTMVMAGKDYTGPSMNPANAYGWAYVNNWHKSSELFVVYWLAPLIGATLSAFVFKALVKPPQPKVKKA